MTRTSFIIVLLPLLAACACSSSHNTVRHTATQSHITATTADTVHTGSTHTGAVSNSATSDSSSTVTLSRGAIAITRDSTGRPVRISWDIAGRTTATAAGRSATRRQQSRRDSVQHSSSTTSGQYQSATNSKATQRTRLGIAPEMLAGTAVALLVLAYLVYLLISDIIIPWIRKHRP